MPSRSRVDPYLLALLATVAVASAFPCRGAFAEVMHVVSDGGIMLLFFLYGGRLAPRVILEGLSNWRLQLTVFAATYVLFPALGLGLFAGLSPWLSSPLLAGLLFLSVLPSTVQSSIAFTSIARGNVPAAICSATLSNVVGVVLTPALVALLLQRGDGSARSLEDAWRIVRFLLLPFAAGQLLRPVLRGPLDRHKGIVGVVDKSSILLVVYVAFSEGVVAGIWRALPPEELALLVAVATGLLGGVLVITTFVARRMHLSKEDEVVVVFCGSKKSLASGLPMAKVLFAGPTLGLVVLPLMIFHSLQLVVCAMMARRLAHR